MTFQNIKPGRVMMAVLSIWGLSIILAFLISCVTTPFMPAEMGDRALDYLDVFSNPDATPSDIEEQRAGFWNDFGSELTVQYIIQWTFVALIIFWITARVGRQADSQRQAAGYGVLIGVGVMISYGLLCACLPSLVLGSSTLVLIAGMFATLFIAAGYFGGRSATQVITARPAAGTGIGFGGTRPTFGPQAREPRTGEPPVMTDSVRPETYYNMGVQAAFGGRREEARQHFTHVLQAQPRNVSAWLQLANLADTPEQAWNYVQQARSISPNDPAVIDAVNVIWPQVAATAEKRDLLRNQPAYPGGQQDDIAIPRTRLPGPAPDAADVAPGTEPDQPAAHNDQPGDPPAPDSQAPDVE